ncbi:OLC1v1039064C1 [Oldenlandia corymbosa var. corymbosa]|uniref:Flap endonuclease GEN-like 1 n=1 Tax=Oldenlandia corymbosa var. corymbosa TaxID=529605 RepID=A0AAV1D3H0_OLDCO|nr:OLC1v1039064C1 [Oldenlandia corymbosa var. corymbosa]
MGVGGNFWDLLKPYARSEGFDFLREKRVAVDLSYWIVQNETAIKGQALNPHIRLIFFRTINLFSKFGAYPVFVVDGTPSHLKSQARIKRYFRASGVDMSSLPVPKDGISVERNKAFQKSVKECIEFLQLLGMPVLRAEGEAEALCAQLNREGHVDACITADSDAFLFGAKCVIKHIRPNSKDPLECYLMSDIEAGLGLKRKHLIAISLLVGSDHDLNGIQGIGVDKAIRFLKPFSEEEVLNRLLQVGRGENILLSGDINSNSDFVTNVESPKSKLPHCSLCGHPGSKKAHFQTSCEICVSVTGEGCTQKPPGFKCNCARCSLEQEAKEKRKREIWQLKICEKIALEPNFPNSDIIDMYLRDNNGTDDVCDISWKNPDTEMLIDYLAYSQRWEPSYIRKMMLPFMSTLYLRDVASNRSDILLCGQYEFHSIQRIKKRLGHQLYAVKWKRNANAVAGVGLTTPLEPDLHHELGEADESADLLEEPDVPQVYIEDGCWFLLTDEELKLVQNAYPEKVNVFLKEKELKEKKSKGKKTNLESPRGVQLSITEFYRSSKAVGAAKPPSEVEAVESSKNNYGSPGIKRKEKSSISKSVRRRLLFA